MSTTIIVPRTMPMLEVMSSQFRTGFFCESCFMPAVVSGVRCLNTSISIPIKNAKPTITRDKTIFPTISMIRMNESGRSRQYSASLVC